MMKDKWLDIIKDSSDFHTYEFNFQSIVRYIQPINSHCLFRYCAMADMATLAGLDKERLRECV